MSIANDGSRGGRYFEKGLTWIGEKPIKLKWYQKPLKLKLAANWKILIASTRKSGIQWLRKEVGTIYDEGDDLSRVLIICVDYFKDSMIQKKYVMSQILKGLKKVSKPKIIMVEFTENDYILSIEDEFDDAYSFKPLSKYYKGKLLEVYKSCEKSKLEESGESIKDDKYKSEFLTNISGEKQGTRKDILRFRKGKGHADSRLV